MKIHFALPVAAISQAWPHCLWLLLPIWHTQHWVRLFCSVRPDSCTSFWPSPALLAICKILSISHFHPPAIVPAQTTAGLTLLRWAGWCRSGPEPPWSCGRDASPWTGLAQALPTLVPKNPPNASVQPQPQGHPSRNAFRRYLGVFKDLR